MNERPIFRHFHQSSARTSNKSNGSFDAVGTFLPHKVCLLPDNASGICSIVDLICDPSCVGGVISRISSCSSTVGISKTASVIVSPVSNIPSLQARKDEIGSTICHEYFGPSVVIYIATGQNKW